MLQENIHTWQKNVLAGWNLSDDPKGQDETIAESEHKVGSRREAEEASTVQQEIIVATRLGSELDWSSLLGAQGQDLKRECGFPHRKARSKCKRGPLHNIRIGQRNQERLSQSCTLNPLDLLPFACLKPLDPPSDASCREPELPVGPAINQLVESVKQAGARAFLQLSRPAELPEPQVKLSQWEPFQGDTVAVLVSVPPPRGLIDHACLTIRTRIPAFGPLVKVSIEKCDVPAYPRGADGTWRALIPTTPLDRSGTRDLQVLIRDGRHSPLERVIYLQNRDYLIESIRLPEHKAGLIGGATSEEVQAMGSLRSIRTPRQLWTGPFVRPSEGDVTTGYGVRRYYNDQFAERYYHRGVDYGADTGTPVVSPADAHVALVGREDDGFRLHGNCVGLDHGQGVVSAMLHLESVRVKEGEFVKAGQVVGTVGETGIATGPHLHWGLYVNGECIDPDAWMQPQFWL